MSEQPTKRIRVVAAVVSDGERYLITQRRETAVLPLLWEFPGGRVEDGERDAEALRRELLERLSARAEVGELISFVSHRYERYTVDLYLYDCRLLAPEIECRGVRQHRWVTSQEFDAFEFTPADEASMSQLLGES